MIRTAEEERARRKAYDAEYNRRPAVRARYREWKRRNRKRADYGIQPEEFEALKAAQNFVCAICGREPRPYAGKVEGFNVDHCHATNSVRGLLCGNCNRAIGLLGDDPAVLDAAAAYLRKHAT
jgi:hypothetical protein